MENPSGEISEVEEIIGVISSLDLMEILTAEDEVIVDLEKHDVVDSSVELAASSSSSPSSSLSSKMEPEAEKGLEVEEPTAPIKVEAKIGTGTVVTAVIDEGGEISGFEGEVIGVVVKPNVPDTSMKLTGSSRKETEPATAELRLKNGPKTTEATNGAGLKLMEMLSNAKERANNEEVANEPKSAATPSEEQEPTVEAKAKEVNILLLGETGVGKSTWLNAIANYLIYDTLEDAIQNEMQVLIPSAFTMTNENYEKIQVSIGENDPNEVHAAGRSATQMPKSYLFRVNDTLIRIIDTPGIGDTRGIEKDKENFQRIMDHLSHVNVIHGICILLKPNHARLSISFEFCLKELLTQLHRDSAANIAFCFTNARSTFYRPGDTLTPLGALLTNDNTTPPLVPLTKKTIYCLDNEAFRFLAAVKNGENFEPTEQQNFSTSWETSRNETKRLVEYLRGIKPHVTKNTVNLNETRQIISKLAKPLAEVSRNIQSNIAVLQDRSEELQNLDLKGRNLRKKLKIPQIDLELIELNYPRTVCAHPECTEKISIYETTELI